MEVGVTACGQITSHDPHNYEVTVVQGTQHIRATKPCSGQVGLTSTQVDGSMEIPQPERVRLNLKAADVERVEAIAKGMSAIGLDPQNPGSVGDVLARCGELAERYQRGLDNQLAAINRLQARIATLEGHVQVHHSELHEAYDDAEPWACDYREMA